MKMPTKEQVLKASRQCPDAKAILEDLFPTAFQDYEDDEWTEIELYEMELHEREGKSAGEIGVIVPGEDSYMPYNVDVSDAWRGDRDEDGNPQTKKFTYKLVGGRIFQKKGGSGI